MTIDEAIKICEEDAEKIGGNPQSDRHAERCRQLAEWLTELKDLREENKVLISECDRLIKEKGELLKKSEQIAKYKSLLKAAVEDLNEVISTRYDNFQWRYADEALALIGEDGERNEL